MQFSGGTSGATIEHSPVTSFTAKPGFLMISISFFILRKNYLDRGSSRVRRFDTDTYFFTLFSSHHRSFWRLRDPFWFYSSRAVSCCKAKQKLLTVT